MATSAVFPHQLRKGDRILIEELEYQIERIESVFGGSWYNLALAGEIHAVPFGRTERIERVA